MKNHGVQAVAVVLALMGLCSYAGAANQTMVDMQNGFIQLAEQIKPLVVNIDTEGTTTISNENLRQFKDLFKFFGIPFEGAPNMQIPKELQMAVGSGFVYDKQGHIITNNHVVENAETIKVKMANGKEYDATLVGRDPDSDLAVIKIQPEGDIPAATLGDSDKLKVGQFAIACGSPRGFEGSFTFGHVSALQRSQLPLPGLRFENFIQTDAAINPGNSGGPLCDINGEVIGINVAIVAGANAIGFAIPVNTAKNIIPQLIEKGKVIRGFLGVGVTDATPYAKALGLPDKNGAFVKTVAPGSPAAQAGIKPYDVIRKVNGAVVESAQSLVQTVSGLAPGTAIQVELWRDQKPLEVSVKLGEYEGKEKAPVPEKEILGIQVENLTPDVAQRLQLKSGTSGVVVTQVDPTSYWAEAGLNEGDVITEIAQQKVNNSDDFSRLLQQHVAPGKSVLVGYIRNGKSDITVINVPKKKEVQQTPAPAPQPPSAPK